MMLQAVILDWAGTVVDFGCQAPVVVLKEIFIDNGIELTSEEARRDMGLLKKDHIRSVLAQPRVSDAWATRHGAPPSESDVQRLFEQFTPRQIARLGEYSDLIPEVLKAVQAMRERGLRIGSTTGYTRSMLDVVLEKASRQGYTPDVSVAPDEAGGGRPAPWMCFQNMFRLGVYPPQACVKIGDTPSDMQEGLNAGMWTIGVVDSGNEIGLTLEDWARLNHEAKGQARASAADRLRRAGAHYVVNTLAEVAAVLDEVAGMPAGARARYTSGIA